GLYYLRQYECGRRRFTREKLLEFLKLLRKEKDHEYFEFLEKLCKSDIFWDEVKEISRIKEDWVYDLTVDGEHNFIANDLIIHNTATVMRDEQFFGGWVLEAGALIMANKSLLAIDEFSKISQQDQVALQEAMSLGTVSIAKASIVATLPAMTSILAGGNPKLGRFDPYIPIREQIDISDVLLSRFDLRFALRDVPNPELDAKMADHILRVRHFEEEETKPAIDTEFLRKYIAYARAHIHPKLTKEAGEKLREFYVKMRSKASGGEAPVPITLRQYEALIRLAEASAKVRLSNKVTVEDAERAIRLMKVSLRQFGFDPETGMFDIDRAEGALPASQRSKMRTVLDIVEELEKALGKIIPEAEVIKRAKDAGIEDIEDILKKMKTEGVVFSPKPGFIQRV
ncbi:MAG TPA: cell division protein, partial [Candidatus Aenigmarchaeota archaeon]|nr:cell division protein [Candidatus Aenigmarchaeota archaeon]